jgi:hypothetical protein
MTAAELCADFDELLIDGAIERLLQAGRLRQIARGLRDPETQARARWLADRWESEARERLASRR